MLSYEQVKKHMDFWKEYKDKQDKWDEALNKYNKDFLELAGMTMPFTEQIEILLAESMADNREEKIVLEEITWWIYETDFGRKKDMTKVFIPIPGKKKEKTVFLTDTKQFYLYLVSFIEERLKW